MCCADSISVFNNPYKNNNNMKANEAPEKIYLNPLLMEDGESVVRLRTFERQRDSQIEYVRTEAFIEKATLWLLTNASDYVALHNGYDTKELVKDFVDAMKRE